MRNTTDHQSISLRQQDPNTGSQGLNKGSFFSLVPPDFSTKKKIANQPITAVVPVNPVTKKGRDWLLGGVFL